MTARVPAEQLLRLCTTLFKKVGVPAQVAEVVAQSLVYADLRGIGSHGVVRMPIYLRRVAEGMINPQADVSVESPAGSLLLVDGRNNFGAYIGTRAVDLGMEQARITGASVVGVRRSNHYGTGAFYAQRAVQQGMALIAVSNASQTMPPVGGIRPFLGTNPFTAGFPLDEGAPFILDMATSLVARGKVVVAAKRGEQIPLGWAVDKDGNPTTDPERALEGAVLPMGGVKGFGLSMAIDILAGVLTGAGYGPSVHNMYENWAEPQDVGHFFIVIDIARFMPLDQFRARLRDYVDLLKREPRCAGVEEIFYAGEIEHRLELRQKQKGVELPEKVVEDLGKLGRQYQVDLDRSFHEILSAG